MNRILPTSISGPTAIVVYVAPKVKSEQGLWYLKKIAGIACIRHLVNQLSSGLHDVIQRRIILSCDSHNLSSLTEALTGSPWEIFCDPSPTGGIVSALIRLAQQDRSIDTVMLFPENALFPSIRLTISLLQQHRQHEREFTVASDIPAGRVPIIVKISSLNGFYENDEHIQDWQGLVAVLNNMAVKGVGCNVTTLGQCRDLLDIVEQLPPELLVTDSMILRLAEELFSGTRAPVEQDAEMVDLIAAYNNVRHLQAQRVPRAPVPHKNGRRVLVTSSANIFSGGEESLYSLLKEMDKMRYRPICFFPHRTLLADKLMELGIHCEQADPFLYDVTPTGLAYWRKVFSVCKPDVIHIDTFVNKALLTAAYYEGIPTVYHVRFLFRKAFPREGLLATRVIAISETVAKWLIHLGVNREDITVIYNGVDLDRFIPATEGERLCCRRRYGIDERERVLCMIARVCPEKQHWLLLRALPHILASCPNVKVLFVGETLASDRAYAKMIRRLTKELNVEEKVLWIDFESDISAAYSASDALVMCSRREPFGRCIIEALSMGLPVVAPQIGGPVEILTSDVYGTLYTPCDEVSLAAAAIHVLSNLSSRTSVCREARERAQDFDIAKHSAKIVALYDSLVSMNRPCWLHSDGPGANVVGDNSMDRHTL